MNNYKYPFEKFEIWHLNVDLSALIYQLTNDFPKEEKYGIVSQLKRAANSVGANIAEGSGRKSIKEKARYLEIAYGSLLEVLSHLHVSTKLGFLNDDKYNKIRPHIEKLSNKINAYNRSLNK